MVSTILMMVKAVTMLVFLYNLIYHFAKVTLHLHRKFHTILQRHGAFDRRIR